jgi:signal peptidase II
MFYFPIIETYWPDWVPFVGGELFEFNNYIFNFADLSITVGVIWIVFLGAFSKKFSL